MLTTDFYVERFRTKSLDWLYLQLEATEFDNGSNYRKALEILISEKEEEGETRSKRRKTSCIIVMDDDDSDKDYVTRPLPSGPKGQTTVVRIPKSVFCGD